MADKREMTEEQAKLDRLIARVEEHQRELDLGDTPFVARYGRYLGSAKSWRDRLTARAWGEINVMKATERLTALVDRINGAAFVHARIIESLPITAYALACYEIMDARCDDRRVSWLIAPTGVGKSWAMQAVLTKARSAAAYVQADMTWKDRPIHITAGLALAVGATVGNGACETMRNIVEHLRGNKITLCVDDVQDTGVAGLKILKSLIDKTPSRLILGIYPTGWAGLMAASTAARSEAHQLLGRSIKPVVTHWAGGVREADVEAFLRAGKVQGALAAAAGRMTPHLKTGGNMRTLADALDNASGDAEERGVALCGELVEAHVLALLNKEPRQ